MKEQRPSFATLGVAGEFPAIEREVGVALNSNATSQFVILVGAKNLFLSWERASARDGAGRTWKGVPTRIQERRNRFGVALHDVLVRCREVRQRSRLWNFQHERVIQTAGSLNHRPTAAATSKDGHAASFTLGEVHFRVDFVGIADDDKVISRFPKPEDFVASVRVARVEQRLVAGEVLGGRG